jgi:4-amino-4-deoxy-L-arabinose transferase-like glycosyltransferase
MLRKINSQRGKEIVFLVLLLAINVILRFYKLAETGLWSSDEVAYFMICRDVIETFHKAIFITPGIFSKFCGLYQALQLLTQYPPKFGFYLVNSLALALFNSQSTMLFISAIFSILTIVIVFFIGRGNFNFRTGVIASILFSFSLIYLRYSRNGFSMTATYFFLVLSVYYYLEFLKAHSLKRLVVSGLLLGVALFFHSQILFFLLIIMLVEFFSFLFFYGKDLEKFLKRITVFISSFFVPLALLEVSLNIGRIFGCFSGESYFRQIINTAAGNTALQQGGFNYPTYYIDLFWYLESPIIFILAIACIPLILRRLFSASTSKQSLILVSGLFVVPYLYWALQRRMLQLDYNVLGAWPFLFLCIAIGLDTLFQRIKSSVLRASVIVAFLIISLSYSFLHLKTLFEIKSHFPLVSATLEKRGIKKLIAYKTGGICGYKNIDPYLKNVDIYPADSLKEVYAIAKEKGVEYCFYSSWDYFLAQNKGEIVEGEQVEKIKDTAMRPHFPLLFMGLMSSGIRNTAAGAQFLDKRYDYMYLYKMKPHPGYKVK